MYHKMKITIYKIRLSKAFESQFHFLSSKLYSCTYIIDIGLIIKLMLYDNHRKNDNWT